MEDSPTLRLAARLEAVFDDWVTRETRAAEREVQRQQIAWKQKEKVVAMLVAKERGKVEELKKSLDGRTNDVARLSAEVASLKAALAKSEADRSRIEAEEAKLRSETAALLRADVAALREVAAKETAQDQHRLSASIEDNEFVKALREELSTRASETTELKNELSVRDTKIASLQTAEDALRARLVTALEASAKLQKDHLALISQLEDRDDKLDEKDDIIDELNAQIAELKEKLAHGTAAPGPRTPRSQSIYGQSPPSSPRGHDPDPQKLVSELTEKVALLTQQVVALGGSPDERIVPSSPRSKEEAMKRNILQELVKTERDYLEDVKTLNEVVLPPLRDPSLLGEERSDEMLRDFGLLLSVNEKLLEKLLLDREGTNVAKIMSDFIDTALRPYSEYCSGAFAGLSQALLKNSSKWAAFRKKVEADPRLKGMPVEASIIKPVQRICRYPLLLNELRKATPRELPEFAALENLIEKFNDAVHTINDIRREHEMMHRALELGRVGVAGLQEFEFWGKTRRLLRELAHAQVAIVDYKGQENWKEAIVWMLTDCVIIAKRQKRKTILNVVAEIGGLHSSDSYAVLAMCRFTPTLGCGLVGGKSGHPHVLHFKDQTVDTTYLISFEKSELQKEWFDAIDGMLSALKAVQETQRARRARIEPLSRGSGSWMTPSSRDPSALALSPRGMDGPPRPVGPPSPSKSAFTLLPSNQKKDRSSTVKSGGSLQEEVKLRRSGTLEPRLSSSNPSILDLSRGSPRAERSPTTSPRSDAHPLSTSNPMISPARGSYVAAPAEPQRGEAAGFLSFIEGE